MQHRDSDELLTAQLESLSDQAAILRLAGEIDISSAPLLAEQFEKIAASDLAGVIVDATNVEFMDSTGLHVLVEGKRALHENGARIFLVPSRQVRRVLELVFPDPLFAARMETVDEALAALEGVDNQAS